LISIHQPRSDAFRFFDKICLLSSGNLVYSGPANQILPWFDHLGYQPEERTNILDFVVDISSVDTRDIESEEGSRIRVDCLVEAWKKRESFEKHYVPDPSSDNALDIVIQRVTSDSPTVNSSPASRPRLPAQIVIVTRRALTNNWRDYGQTLGFAMQVLLIGFCTGLAFFRPPETPSGIQVSLHLAPGLFYY
jgi:hypothetical protein